MIILLHSSKTMRACVAKGLRPPALLDKAVPLAEYLKTLTATRIAKTMGISQALAINTKERIDAWTSDPDLQSPAIDCFLGDIYSGLRTAELSSDDRDYADQTVRILSGLYGILRPNDGICPYRLEMAYKLPKKKFSDLYAYWTEAVLACLPADELVVNASSIEYSQMIIPRMDPLLVVTPKFMTADPKTGEPVFVVVHAKIARGAFARWLITSRISEPSRFAEFQDLGYALDESLSTPNNPVFVCQAFGGKGLSQRLR